VSAKYDYVSERQLAVLDIAQVFRLIREMKREAKISLVELIGELTMIRKKKRSGLSLFDLFSMGFGAMVGVGWSATLNNLYKNGGGPIPATIGFSLATIVFIPIALCFAELAPAVPVSGGVIAYAKKAFGKKMTFIAGWFVAMAYISIVPWESIAINDIVSYIFPVLKSGSPIYTLAGENIYLPTIILGIVMSGIVFTINWHGVEKGATFQTIMTLGLLVGSLICVVFALMKANISNLITPVYSQISGKNHTTMIAGIFTMFGLAPSYFAGFDTIPQSVEAAPNVKKKAMGKVIVIALFSAGLFYAMIFLSAGLAYPWTSTIGMNRPVLSNMLQTIYPGVEGKILWYICIVATLAGLFSTWNGFYIAGSRVLYGMAKAGVIPELFAREHPKYKTPYIASLFVAVTMVIGPFLGAGILDILSILSSAGFVIGWGIACAAVIKLRKTEPTLSRPYKIPGGNVLPLIAAVCCVAMFFNCVIPGMPGYMGTGGLIAFAVWSALGCVFYYFNNHTVKFPLPKK